MTKEQAWHSFAVAGLNAMLIARQLPMRLDDDYHFIENASDVIAKFADTMTQRWLDRQPKPKKGVKQ